MKVKNHKLLILFKTFIFIVLKLQLSPGLDLLTIVALLQHNNPHARTAHTHQQKTCRRLWVHTQYPWVLSET